MNGGLHVFNTMSLQKEVFTPLVPGRVKMFTCGPTINDLMHLGNARTYVFYDTVARYLAELGYEVKFIMNITDIDESVVNAARLSKSGVEPYIRKYVRAYMEDLKGLKVTSVNRFERVSKYVEEMVNQVRILLKKGKAYRAKGEVYFDVSTFPHFGELSHRTTDELSLRPTELSEEKRTILDFALWRRPPVDGIVFESPWGRGWPGWHIQDTAVTIPNFGPQYDIHGGAMELIYPHHEAEIAEAESITGIRPFVKYWLHCGLLTTEGKKMSKSEGNVVYARDLVRKYGPDAVRLYLLIQNHRESFEFEERTLRRVHEDFVQARESLSWIKKSKRGSTDRRNSRRLLKAFYSALNDDFDTPHAVGAVEEIVDMASRKAGGSGADFFSVFRTVDSVLGVDYLG
jgi:cysteinyl-tRNA synthetase